jgi:hypothetical protein
MSPAPLDLTLACPRPRIVAGEMPALEVTYTVVADFEMVFGGLNESATEVILEALDAGTEERLSGAHHRALHRPSALAALDEHRRVLAGQSWKNHFELALYRAPLPAGRYRISLAYRHGDGPDDVVRSNGVEVEVAAARALGVTDRWLGDAAPRAQLATLWTAEDGGATRWLYRAARPFDLTALLAAYDLRLSRAALAPPVIAHIDDNLHAHFERCVVWLEEDVVAWTLLTPRIRVGEPAALPHGLARDPAPRLLDAPLQAPGETLLALVAGLDAATGAPALFTLHAPEEAAPSGRLTPLPSSPTHAVVVWAGGHSETNAHVFLATGPDAAGVSRVARATGEEVLTVAGSIVALLADGHGGRGRVFALVGGAGGLEAHRWDVPSGVPEPCGRWDTSAAPVHVVTTPGSLALLFRDATAWVIATADARAELPFGDAPAATTPRLVADRRGRVLCVFPDPERGFVPIRVLG